MGTKQPEDISDLLPGLAQPLWEGTDEEFTAYVRDTFGIPASITTITITPRGAAGRSAVAIGGQAGAIIFAIDPGAGKQQTRITPIVAGPLVKDARIVRLAAASGGIDNMAALAALMSRYLSTDVALDLMAPKFH